MSQCNNCQRKPVLPEIKRVENIENFENCRTNADNFNVQKDTYKIDGGYYAPPWPAQRTKYDAGLQTKFSTTGIPDFLNFSNNVKTQQALSNTSHFDGSRKSIFKGRYDSFSY